MVCTIRYRRSDKTWLKFGEYLGELLERYPIKRVCEVGGGANPLLGIPLLEKKKIDYTV